MKIKKERKEDKSFMSLLKKRFDGMTFKSYVKETFEFINEYITKKTLIMLVIAVLMMLGTLGSPEVLKADLEVKPFIKDYWQAVQVIVVVIFSGMVPYMYVPVIGILSAIAAETTIFANLVLEFGKVKALTMYIIPYVLNILVVAVSSAIGMYICNNATLSQRITSVKSKNSMDFKLTVYEATNKKDKIKALKKEREDKIKKLESKKKEIDLFQVVNIAAILSVIQLVASFTKVLAR